MANGVAFDEIAHAMATQHNMTQGAVERLHNEVIKGWANEEAANKPHAKRMQLKRLQAHIAGARKGQQWGAVAALERLMAQILGTMEPIQIDVTMAATIRESVLNVVATTTPERLLQLATQALVLRRASGRQVIDAPTPSVAVDAAE